MTKEEDNRIKYLENEVHKLSILLRQSNVKMEAMRKKFRSDIIKIEGQVKRATTKR